MARFRRDKWPEEESVRALLSYLEDLREGAGRPSLSEMGRSVALAPSTLSGFFTGARLIGRGNLELLVEHLGGDVAQAERLRRKAVSAWHAPRPTSRQASRRPEPLDPTGRLEIVIYTTPVNQLNRPEQLLGRLPLIREVSLLLDSSSRVLLHGLGGSGKTALAATLADQRVEAGRGPYLWLRPGLADADAALDALGRALCAWDTAGFPEPVPQSAVSRSSAQSPPPEPFLAARSPAEPTSAGAGGGGHDADLLRLRAAVAASGVTLCVIDDAAQPAVLHALLRAMPEGLPVLVTSRRKLALEHQIEVAGLAAPDAVRLLALHACAENVAADPGAATLCADLGHHPYAIEIAGQHLRQYGGGPAELRAQLAGAPHELAVPGGFAPPGRESIRRLLDHTVSALDSADAVAVLRAFGAFRSAGATVELLAEYLAVERTRVEVALKSLVDLSLAKRSPGTSYYAIHDLTLCYARSLNESKVEGRAILAARAFTAAHRDEHDLLALELDNLLGAAAIASESDVDSFLAIIEDLASGQFLNAKGYPLALVRLLDDAIELLRERDCLGRLHFLLSKRGNAHFNHGELETAADVYSEALACAPDDRRRIVLLSVVGKVLAELGKHDEAESYFARAHELSAATSDEHGRLRVLEQHSVAAFWRKDFRRVLDLTSQGIELGRRLGARTLEVYFLNNHGTAEFELGLLAAIERHEQAQRLAADLGDDHALALTHRALGADRHAQEDFALAQRHFQQALELYTALGETGPRVKLERLMHQFGYRV
jgi:tetratricopeptide (TPR) repeat protein